MQYITMPMLTAYLGPYWLNQDRLKTTSKLAKQKNLLQDLAKQIPKTLLTCVNCHPDMETLLPLRWEGYTEKKRYTYRLQLTDKKELWDNLDAKQRNVIFKAKDRLEVVSGDDIDLFYDLNQKPFDRQDIAIPYNRDFIKRMDQVLTERKNRKILFAKDAKSVTQAAVYAAYDHHTVYLIAIGSDPEHRNQGGVPLLIWSLIEFFVETHKIFDFEGSVIPNIEAFFRSFGGDLVSYSRIIKTSNKATDVILKVLGKYE